MVEKLSNVKVASVQISPICMDPISTTKKVCENIKTAGKEGDGTPLITHLEQQN